MAEIDEVALITALRPEPPADAEEIRCRARARLDAALAAPPRRTGLARWPGRTTQRWHGRSLGLGAAVAGLIAAAVIAVTVLPAGGSGSFVTDAWAVQRSADGTITVTINRALTHQAQLQADLRKDGVKAYVRPLTRCSEWKPKGGVKLVLRDWKAMLFPAPGNHDKDFGAIIIHPARIPRGYVVFIGGSGNADGLSLQMYLMRGSNGPPVCVPRKPGAGPG